MYTPLGNFTGTQLFYAVGADPAFSSLTDQQKMQVLNSVRQRIENECLASEKPDYLTDLAAIDDTSPTLIGALPQHYIVQNVPMSGFKIPFSRPFDDTNYSISMRVYNSGGQDVGWSSYTKYTDGLTVHPNVDGAIVDLVVGAATVIEVPEEEEGGEE